jgi:hypothetical protein
VPVVVGTCPPVMADPNIPPLLPATELEAVAEFPDLSNDVVWQSFAKLSTLKLLPLLLSILLFPLYILPEMEFLSREVPPAAITCMAIVCLSLSLESLLPSSLLFLEFEPLLPLLLLASPTIVNVNIPLHVIAGNDGNHGDRDPVGIANDVGGRNDCVGGNTEGGNVVCTGGNNGTNCCCCVDAIWAYATETPAIITITIINKQTEITENKNEVTFLITDTR